jgi:hypothetical protein
MAGGGPAGRLTGMKMPIHRFAAVAVAGALVAASFAAPAAGWAGPTRGAEPPPPSTFDFRDCPRLPAGADPSAWRCEVQVATGRLRLGGVDLGDLAPMTVTFAEGPWPDGTHGQVFGSLRSDPTPVPGGLLGVGGHNPWNGLAVRVAYAGYFDGYNRSEMDVTVRVLSPLSGRHCAIGSGKDPVRLRIQRSGPAEWISREPPLVKVVGYERTFALPRSSGCGPLRHVVDRRFGLPAAAGTSALELTSHYTFRYYAQM